jgi:acyl-coenzyme A synthetase/AMP-(fatty) acid ligase
MARSYRWQVGDLLWSLGDFHTMSGLRNPCIATLHAGAAFLVAPPETRGNALVVAEELQRHGVTILATVPALLRQFLRLATRLGNQPLVGVRQVFCTGSILTPEVEAAFRKRFMVPVYNYYGLTETAGLCLGIIPGNRAEAGAIGWPIGSEILIVDDDGSPAPDGEAGELLVRSNNLMSGYFRGRQPHDVSSLRDGWYVTGDLARRNPDGSITLLGRISDAIKDVRGELLHPAEIERALERHPLVAEAGVCGIAGPDGEERLAACIVPAVKVTAEESFLSEVRQNLFEILGPTRLPARFQLVAELPRGTGGKLLRGQLSELLSEEGNGV